MHIPKDERHKLDSKCKKCILLGYGEKTKGYRLYDPVKKKVFYSRDVKFNEDERKSSQEKEVQESTDSTYRMELDFSESSEVHTDDNHFPTEEPSESAPRRSE